MRLFQQSILDHAPAQRVTLDAEQFGGMSLIAAGAFQGLQHQFALYIDQRDTGARSRPAPSRRPPVRVGPAQR